MLRRRRNNNGGDDIISSYNFSTVNHRSFCVHTHSSAHDYYYICDRWRRHSSHSRLGNFGHHPHYSCYCLLHLRYVSTVISYCISLHKEWGFWILFCIANSLNFLPIYAYITKHVISLPSSSKNYAKIKRWQTYN